MFFHLLKTYIRNPSLFFISFSPFYIEVNDDANHDSSAHICAGEVSFAKLVCQPVEDHFFLFYQN
jgi:hypothetical protein